MNLQTWEPQPANMPYELTAFHDELPEMELGCLEVQHELPEIVPGLPEMQSESPKMEPGDRKMGSARSAIQSDRRDVQPVPSVMQPDHTNTGSDAGNNAPGKKYWPIHVYEFLIQTVGFGFPSNY